MDTMKELAVYGKGGIGKSTLSANLSAALALMGHRVLQIGCDPKHDSTRLLTHGERLQTVLDYLRVTGPADYKQEDILTRGFAGVGCVEAGGPKPGVGCAGRGIISTFELLNQLQLKQRYELIIYDVLGDVVCGGFAVPIRREYADTILLVTSGEFMALYAANNILRGIRNYDNDERRIAGIVYNKRNIDDEDARIARFARAVRLPVITVIPRSNAFAKAEQAKMTVMERGDDPDIREIFMNLARHLTEGCTLYEANPLSDEALESVVLCDFEIAPEQTAPECVIPLQPVRASERSEIDLTSPNRYLSKNVLHSEPLHGCAFNGAMSLCAHIRDAVVLAHAPKSCVYLTFQTISSTGRRTYFERGSLLPVALSPNLAASELGETEMVFGGMEKLENKLEELMSLSPSAIIIVSACPAGIIGDDIDLMRRKSRPDLPVVTIKADGNIAGDYLQGMLMSYTSLAGQIIKRDVPVIPDTVNIVGEKIVVTNTDSNYQIISGFLSRLGVTVNCRFIYQTAYSRLEQFTSAQLNLPAYRDYAEQLMEHFLKKEFGSSFFDRPFPVGYTATEDWLRGVAAHFGRPEQAEAIIAEHRQRYLREIEALKPELAGKKLMIITYNHEMDWILQTALDIGIEIVKIGILDFSQDEGFRSRLGIPLNVTENYDRSNRREDIARYRPDILLTNYASSVADEVRVADTIPMCPDVGFFSGLVLAKRWAKLMKLNLKGEWLRDEHLFKQYYAG
jgi:nitrogenase iron protein